MHAKEFFGNVEAADIPSRSFDERVADFKEMVQSEALEFKTARKLEEGDTLVDWDELPKEMRHNVKKYWEKLKGPKYKHWSFDKKIRKLQKRFNLKIVDDDNE